MSDILEYPDNLVLHLERDRRSYKLFTTEKRGTYKVIYGLSDKDGVIDIKFMNNEREIKQLVVDSCINGFTIKLNLLFKRSFYGLAKELAKEREEQLKALENENEVPCEVVEDTEDTKFN